MGEASFWDNGDRARETVQSVKELRLWVEPYDKLANRLQTALELEELLELEPDQELIREAEAELESLAA